MSPSPALSITSSVDRCSAEPDLPAADPDWARAAAALRRDKACLVPHAAEESASVCSALSCLNNLSERIQFLSDWQVEALWLSGDACRSIDLPSSKASVCPGGDDPAVRWYLGEAVIAASFP